MSSHVVGRHYGHQGIDILSPHLPKVIALTFDDGPTENSHAIRQILKEQSVKATMFLIGENVKRHQTALQDDGDNLEIGWHTLTHAFLKGKPASFQQKEIGSYKDVLGDYANKVKVFRPPYGAFDKTTLEVARQEGLLTVLWDIDTLDWETRRTTDEIKQSISQNLHSGAVVLMHELHHHTVVALPDIISHLKSLNWEFVTVSDLVQRPIYHDFLPHMT